jgi:hypothetical protein
MKSLSMPDELVRRAVEVLLKLRTLSEVPARAYDREKSTDTAEDRLPVHFTASGDLAPVEPSEFLFHRGRINESRTRMDFEVAVLALRMRGGRCVSRTMCRLSG